MMQINLYICTDGNEDTRITAENNIVSYPCTGRMPGKFRLRDTSGRATTRTIPGWRYRFQKRNRDYQ